MPDNAIEHFEVEERLGELLPSQKEFVFSPARFSAIAGGFGSGKTRAGVLKGLLLSALYPGNVGMIARFHGSDLEDTTIPVFFEVCPPSWIKAYNKKTRTVVLRNGSVVLFRHIHDASAQKKNQASTVTPKTRRLGANLGWFFIDQMEEIDIEHWLAMISRLRLPKAKLKYGFGALNPNGHDWIWRAFFPQFRPWKRDGGGRVIEFFQASTPTPNVLGVAVNSEENRSSNGGFVEDAYFDSLLNSYPPEWVERYIYCSFEDFTGKIYKEFRSGLVQVGQSDKWEEVDDLASVHIVEPFPIPSHWDLIVSIDVGGAGKWAVTPMYVDEEGNLVVVPGYNKKANHVGVVAQWIKMNLPWNENRTRYVIDWENKVAALELAQHGIHPSPANKAVRPGILRVGGYMHVQRGRKLPSWYEDTQPNYKYHKFKNNGSPRLFLFRTATVERSEHDTYVWNPNKPDEPFKTNTQRWDTCDTVRYGTMLMPEPSVLQPTDEKFERLAKLDPLTYREWVKFDKRVAARQYKQKGGGGLREADMDEVLEGIAEADSGRHEYAGEGEF